MKTAALNAIFILMLGVGPVYADTPTAIWQYSVDDQQNIDGFALHQVIKVDGEDDQYINLGLDIVSSDREKQFNVTGIEGECRFYTLTAFRNIPGDIYHSEYADEVKYCLDYTRPNKVIVFGIKEE